MMPIECKDGRFSAICTINNAEDTACTENMYESIFTEAPDAIFILDAEKRTILRWSREAEKLTGYPSREINGKVYSSLFSQKDRQRIEDALSSLSAEKALTERAGLMNKDRGAIPVEVSARIVSFNDKRLIIVRCIDTTEIESRMAEIRQRNEELSAINYIASTVSSTLDLDVMLDRTIHKVCEVTGMDIGSIFLLDERGEMLTLYAYAGTGRPATGEGMKVSQCVGGKAVLEKNPVVYEDFQKCPDYAMGMHVFDEARSVVFLPIVFQGRVLGVMGLASNSGRQLTDEYLRLFSSIANTIGISVNNARYVQYVKAQAKKFSLLFKTAGMLTSTLDLNEVLHRFARDAVEASSSDSCAIFFLDEESGMLRGQAAYGLDEKKVESYSMKPSGEIAEAIETKKAYVVHDASACSCLPAECIQRHEIRSFLCMPLVYRDRVTGIILLIAQKEQRAFSTQAIETTTIMSSQAAQAIENARLIDSMKKRNEELRRVYEIQRRITQSIDLGETMESIVDNVPYITKLPYCVIFLIDPSAEQIISVKATEPVAKKFGKLRFNMRDLIASRIAMKERRPLFIEDAEHFQNIAQQVVKMLDMKSIAVLPLIARDRVLGMMWLYGTEKTVHFDSDDIRSAVALSDQAAIIIDNARLFKELEDSYEKLKNLDNMKMEFFTLISHELRNPLAVIKGFTELLYDGMLGPVNDKQKEKLAKMRESVDKLTDMVSKMSDISTIDTKRYPIDRMPTSLNELVNEVVRSIDFIAKEKQVDLQVDVPMSLPLVQVDRAKIEQVLLNLINNAIKYTPPGGRIYVDAADSDHDILISVRDTGIGIPKKDLDKIFTGFYHAGYKLSYEYKGPGLGLAISKRIIESHGGRIWAESEAGKGSTFYFTIPKSLPEDLKAQSEAKTQSS
jgi:PAS domain S-box-containing protein